MATDINALDQSVVPVEEMNAEEVTETSSNLNISLTARERLMKKLQGISTMVSIAMIVAWHGVIKQMVLEVIVHCIIVVLFLTRHLEPHWYLQA